MKNVTSEIVENVNVKNVIVTPLDISSALHFIFFPQLV